MEATLALIFASIIDVPSFVSIIGGSKSKKLWQAIAVAFLAAFLGEMLGLIVGLPTAGNWTHFPHRFVAQLIVALAFYGLARIKRNKKSIEQGK